MKRSTKISIISLFCAVMLAAVIGFISIISVSAEEGVRWDNVTLEDKVSGYVLEIPERKVYVDGDTNGVVADFRLIFPGGNKSSSMDKVTLSEVGKYTLQYFKRINGVDYFKEENFFVKYATFGVQNVDSSIKYVTTEYEYYKSPYDRRSIGGLACSLQDGDSLSFNGIIDLPNENEDFKLLSFYVTPSLQGSRDFVSLYVTFTDVTNPDCYLTFAVNTNPHETDNPYALGGTYVEAGGTDQVLKGLEGTILHENDGFGGFCWDSSFYGLQTVDSRSVKPVDSPNHIMTLAFNPVTCDVKAGNYDSTVGGAVIRVINTNSAEYFGGEEDVKWAGFESGKIRVTITPKTLQSASANFVVTSVLGVDLTQETVEDNEGPILTVHSDYDINKMPNAWVNYEYSIPEATSFDMFSGECDVNTFVYSNYTSTAPDQVEITGGKFVPNKAGTYTIVYVAKDAIGNESTEEIWVKAYALPEEIKIEVPEEKKTSCVVGEYVAIPKPTVSGGAGKLQSSVYIEDSSFEFVTEINISDLEWNVRFENAGTFYVCYKYTDYNGYFETEKYAVTVTTPTAPSFRESSVTLPMVMASGFDYLLPELIAYDYTSGSLNMYKAKVKVIDKDGEHIYVSGEKFKPVVENSGDKISVTYYHEYGENTPRDYISLTTMEIPVVILFEGRGLAFANLFYSETVNYSTEMEAEGLKFTVNSDDFLTWTFANQLNASGFGFEIYTPLNVSFDKMTVNLTDSMNTAQTLNVVINNNDGYFTVFANGKTETATVNKTMDGKYYSYAFSINSNGRAIFDGKSYGILEGFGGFDSGKVTFTLSLEGVSEGFNFWVHSVLNHGFSNVTGKDVVSPSVSVLGNYGGTKHKGDLYVINPAVFSDVISPNVKATLTVTSPSGQIVSGVSEDLQIIDLDEADASKSYEITLNELGEYKVCYTVMEENSKYQNTDTVYCNVLVADVDAPVVDFKNVPPKAVKKGSVISVPDYTVYDDVSKVENITVIIGVQNSNGRFGLLTEKAFKCDFVGEYELRMLFTDEAGNSTLKTFTIKVVE